MKNLVFLIILLSCVLNAKSQNYIIEFSEDSTITIHKDTCCEYRTKPTTPIEGFYVIDNIDTIYFKTYRNLLKCVNGTTILSNPNRYCQILTFGKPVTSNYYIRHINEDSTTYTFSGVLKDGYYENGTMIIYYPNGQIKRIGQIENGWKSGLWTNYYPNSKIQYIFLFIPEVSHNVTEWEYNKEGELIDYSDERKIMEEILKERKIKYGF